MTAKTTTLLKSTDGIMLPKDLSTAIGARTNRGDKPHLVQAQRVLAAAG